MAVPFAGYETLLTIKKGWGTKHHALVGTTSPTFMFPQSPIRCDQWFLYNRSILTYLIWNKIKRYSGTWLPSTGSTHYTLIHNQHSLCTIDKYFDYLFLFVLCLKTYKRLEIKQSIILLRKSQILRIQHSCYGMQFTHLQI